MGTPFAYILTLLGGTVCCTGILYAMIVFAESPFTANTGNTVKTDSQIHDASPILISQNLFGNEFSSEAADEYAPERDKDTEEYFEADGEFNFGISYGKSKFTKEKYRLFPDDQPISRIISRGFVPQNEYRLLFQGHAGKRFTVYVDHDSKRENREENKYSVQYRAVGDDEALRELNAGDIDISTVGSKYVLFQSRAEKAYGVDLTFKKGNAVFKAFGSISKGYNEIEIFKGKSSSTSFTIADYQYIRNRYYQLEPFKRYDGITSHTVVVSMGLSAYTSLITYTSKPLNPSAYLPFAVNIETGSLEIWHDDQSGIKKSGILPNPPDGGNYIRLYEGSDYTINYVTGEIEFGSIIGENSRIIAAYRLSSGLSSDPAVRSDIVSGKYSVTIKYGNLTEEDADRNGMQDSDFNKDNSINHDIYEIKSRYSLIEKNILPESFRIDLFKDNRLITEGVVQTAGGYDLDSKKGIIKFNLREPYRPLMSVTDAGGIYGSSGNRAYLYSHFSHNVSFYRESRNFQLSKTGIVEGSVSVKVDGSVVAPSLYSVDYIGGLVQFSNPLNPVITETSKIEIMYQYSSVDAASRGFTGGFRSEYRYNDIFNIGGTVLYSQQGSKELIPHSGQEATMNFAAEADATMRLSRDRFSRFASMMSGGKNIDVPLEFISYGEYAKSYYNRNTFGKVLIDDMENSSDSITVSMNEREWFLSSMPTGSVRGYLLYKYFRDASSPSIVRDETFSPILIDYSVKSGPYNILAGHNQFASGDLNSARRAVVFDYDFTSADTVSAAIRLSKDEIDLSGLQYIEVWYRGLSGSGTADISFDIGVINEDSDSDGTLDTEDSNRNGQLDYDISAGRNEDNGYVFNETGRPGTKVGNGPEINRYHSGDGSLSSEDINWNGMLDTNESVISFPGSHAYLNNESAYQPLTVDAGNKEWKSVKIYLRPESLDQSGRYALSHARVIRVNIRKGTGSSGSILIDSIRLISSKWDKVKIGGLLSNNPDTFKAAFLDSWNDVEYGSHSFAKERSGVFQALYGNKDAQEISDERESTLSLYYKNTLLPASIGRTFQKSLDLSFYNILNIWINPRELSSGDKMRVYIGSSENDCKVYVYSLEKTDEWQELRFRLQENAAEGISPETVIGYPELSCVKFIKIEIESAGSGRIWINNIYGSDSAVSVGSAYWTEQTLYAKRPVYVTENGMPVLDNITLSYVQRAHDASFASKGKSDFGISELVKDLKLSLSVIPKLDVIALVSSKRNTNDSFSDTYSSEQRGRSSEENALFHAGYTSINDGIPSVNVSYRGENKVSDKQEMGGKSGVISTKRTHAPKISIQEKIEDFFGGLWAFNIISDNIFQCNEEVRDYGGTVREKEVRQKNELKSWLDYSIGYVTVTSEMMLFNHEIVELNGRSTPENRRAVAGSYHFPFVPTGREIKFSERSVGYSLKGGVIRNDVFNPALSIEYKYSQNGFRDLYDGEKADFSEFSRMHNAQAYSSTGVILPVDFQQPLFGFVRSISGKFSRKIYIDETAVPYQGENTGLKNEKFGMANNNSRLLGTNLNIYKYYPGYFLTGRMRYANGRDYVQKNMNAFILTDSGAGSAYSNTLKAAESGIISSNITYNAFDFASSGGYEQLSERRAVGAVPGQQVTWFYKNELTTDIAKIRNSFEGSAAEERKKFGLKLITGFTVGRTALITKNLREDKYTPSAGILFSYMQSSINVKGSIDFRIFENHSYISPNHGSRDSRDDVYFNAMSASYVSENSRAYTFTAKYETRIEFIRDMIQKLYPVSSSPLFSIEYEYLKNTYSYQYTVSPEPYDRKSLTALLKNDLNKYIKLHFRCKTAIEKWYSRDTNNLYREVLSYELNTGVTVQF